MVSAPARVSIRGHTRLPLETPGPPVELGSSPTEVGCDNVAAMGRAMAAVIVGLLTACGDGRPPAAPPVDASGPRDAGSADAGDVDGAPGRGDGGPRLPAADVEVELPYRGPERTVVLRVVADLGSLDVHFSIDTTGSFTEEIDTMQSDLDGRIVPALRRRVEDVAFGVSRFEDFPAEPWGTSTDQPFELLTPITTDARRVASAVAALDSPLGHGGDAPESGAEALYQIATGEGYRRGTRTLVSPFDGRPARGGGTLGGVGFREGALHVVVHVTDAPTHTPEDYEPTFPGTRSLADAAEALSAVGARTIGIASGEVARSHLETVALATGATTEPTDGSCPTGIGGDARAPRGGTCPLVFDVARDGTGLSDTVVDAIVELVNGVVYDQVYGRAVDDPLGFVHAIEATEADPPDGVPPPTLLDVRPPEDGYDDTFADTGPGTELTFVAHLVNDRLPPADYDQVFHLTVQIVGDGLVLAVRRIRVVVPRGRLDAGLPDAGVLDAGALDAAPALDAEPAADAGGG